MPRVKPSTKGEGHERRYFYGSVWAVTIAQPVLWLMWKALPRGTTYDAIKLAVFVGILAFVGNMARLGLRNESRVRLRTAVGEVIESRHEKFTAGDFAVVGTGYVGLVTGTCFAETGNMVTCIDIDAKKIESLKQGNSPIYEPGLDTLLEMSAAMQALTHATGDHREAVNAFLEKRKPDFKGEIQMANPNSSGTAYVAIATLVQLMGEDKAFDYLKKMHANINAYTRSGTAPMKAVASARAWRAAGRLPPRFRARRPGPGPARVRPATSPSGT